MSSSAILSFAQISRWWLCSTISQFSRVFKYVIVFDVLKSDSTIARRFHTAEIKLNCIKVNFCACVYVTPRNTWLSKQLCFCYLTCLCHVVKLKKNIGKLSEDLPKCLYYQKMKNGFGMVYSRRWFGWSLDCPHSTSDVSCKHSLAKLILKPVNIATS